MAISPSNHSDTIFMTQYNLGIIRSAEPHIEKRAYLKVALAILSILAVSCLCVSIFYAVKHVQNNIDSLNAIICNITMVAFLIFGSSLIHIYEKYFYKRSGI